MSRSYKIHKKFGIPAKKAKKAYNIQDLDNRAKKIVGLFAKKVLGFLRFLAKIFANTFDEVGKFLRDRGESPEKFSEFLARKQENQDYPRS